MKRPGWKEVWKRKGCHTDSPMLRCRWAHWILNNTKDVLTHFGLILLISLLTTVWSRFQTVKHYPMTTLSFNAPVANIYGVCLLDCNYSSDDNRSFIYMKEYQMKTFDILSLFGLTTHIWWLRDMETQYGPFVKSTGHRWIPSQKNPVIWKFDVSLLKLWTSCRVGGDLSRLDAHMTSPPVYKVQQRKLFLLENELVSHNPGNQWLADLPTSANLVHLTALIW